MPFQGPIFESFLETRNSASKKLVVLIDPDKLKVGKLEELVHLSAHAGVDYFFIGGSLVVNNRLDQVLRHIRESCSIPLVLFPGNSFQLSYSADAILFLSLISGRNPELLIGNHVLAAPYLKLSPLEIIPTGYMLVDGGVPTTVQYISNTQPIPANKADVALCTALAGEMLGLKMLYMDAGSGAKNPVPTDMIAAVSQATEIPLIVGGGIKTPEAAFKAAQAGADILVVGTAVEQTPGLLPELVAAVKQNQHSATTLEGQ